MNRFFGAVLVIMIASLAMTSGGNADDSLGDVVLPRDSIDLRPGDDVFSSFVTINPENIPKVVIQNQALDRSIRVQVVGMTEEGAVSIWKVQEIEASGVASLLSAGARHLHLVSTSPFSVGLVDGREMRVRKIETQVMRYPRSADSLPIPDDPPIDPPNPEYQCLSYWMLVCATPAVCDDYSKGANGFIEVSGSTHYIHWAGHVPIGNWITVGQVDTGDCIVYWTPDAYNECPVYASNCKGEGYHVYP